MKKGLLVLLVLITGLNLFSQINSFLELKYSDNIIKLVEGEINNESVIAYDYINDTTIAVLDGYDNVIMQFSTGSNRPINKTYLKQPSVDFEYYDNKYYVLNYSSIQVVNANTGLIEKELYFKIPKNTIFTLEKTKHIGGKNYILSGDGSTWELTENGLIKLLADKWIFTETISGSSIRNNHNSFAIKINDLTKGDSEINVQLSDLGITGKLATVILVDINLKNIILDIETTLGNELKRYLIWFDRDGKYISKTLIPYVYTTHIKNQFVANSDYCTYLLSANKGVYFYKLTSNDISIKLPEGCREIKFTQNESYATNDNSNTTTINKISKVQQSSQAGQYGVTRTQVYQNAMNYLNLEWEATDINIANCDVLGNGSIKTPDWVLVGKNNSIPYKWGGNTDWNEFVDLVKTGKKVGNINTKYKNYCTTNYNTESSNTNVIGVDCSGFVSNCWELKGRFGTSQFGDFSYNFGLAEIAENFEKLNTGDAINYPNNHIRLFLSHNPNGTGNFIEQAAYNSEKNSYYWRVFQISYAPSELKYSASKKRTYYDCLKYKNIVDAKLRLTSPIISSSQTVEQGKPLTINYQIGNYGTESWSGYVQLWIKQSNGNEIGLDTPVGPITLGHGEISQTYTFTSPSVQSPVGQTEFEVRVKNDNSIDRGRFYRVGEGAFENPKNVNILPSSTSADHFINTRVLPVNSGSINQELIANKKYKLTALASQGFTFVKWYEDGKNLSTNTSIEIDLTQDRNIIAFFKKNKAVFQVNASTNLPSSGVITGRKLGIFNEGDTCKLEAIAQNGFTFINWTEKGEFKSSTSKHSFIVKGDRDLVANFVSNSTKYNINSAINLPSSGTISGTTVYSGGQYCNLTAIANPGYEFLNWMENGVVFSENENLSFQVIKNRSLTANFKQVSVCKTCPEYDESLITSRKWQVISSSITANGCVIYKIPVTNGLRYTFKTGCGDLASANFKTQLSLYDKNCNLIVSGDNSCELNRSILNWDCNLTGSTYVFLKITGQNSSYGKFALAYLKSENSDKYIVNCNLNIPEGGSVSGNGSYEEGEICTLTAKETENFTFAGWSEDGTIISNSKTYEFSVSSNKNFEAIYVSNSINCQDCPKYNYSIIPNTSIQYFNSQIAKYGCKVFRIPVQPNKSYIFEAGNLNNIEADFNTTLYLYDSNCNLLKKGIDESENGNSTVTWTCNYSKVDFVYLRVASTDGNYGDFSLSYLRYDPTNIFSVLAVKRIQQKSPLKAKSPENSLLIEDPEVAGYITGNGSYAENQYCVLTATANNGYYFTGWSENSDTLSLNDQLGFIVNGNRNIEANFEKIVEETVDCPNYNQIILPTTAWRAVSSTINKGGYKIYKVPVSGKRTYSFKTGNGDGATAEFDTELILFDANCNELLRDDDGCEQNRSIIEWNCDYETVNYVFVKVKGYNIGSGNFTLSFCKSGLSAGNTLRFNNSLEYFVDNEDSFFSNRPLSFDENGISTNEFNIDISEIPNGGHTLYVKAIDANGKESFIQRQSFWKDAVSINQTPNLKRIEYFFDTDPGINKGSAIPFTAGKSVDLAYTIDLTGVNNGGHTLYVRSIDQNGKSSFIQRQSFWKDAVSINQTPNLKRIEYFFDTDPGINKGSTIPFTAGKSVDLAYTIDLTNVYNGGHTLYVRSIDENGKSSFIQRQSFWKDAVSINQTPNLKCIEYFFDTDPGINKGNAIHFTAGKSVDLAYTIDLSSVSNGGHTLYVRSIDQNGKSSFIQRQSFWKDAVSINQTPNLKRIEYFFDTDPGINQGTAIPFTTGKSVDLAYTIDLTGVNNGGHTLYVRSIDQNGKSSFIQRQSFWKSQSTANPYIVQIEYFVDREPDVKSIFISKQNQAPFIDTEFDVDLTGLTGKHLVYVRAKDSNGHWSFLQAQEVCAGMNVDFTTDKTAYLPNEPILFSINNKTSNTYTYAWDFTNTNNYVVASGLTANYQFAQTGTYQVNLKITGSDGCSSVVSKSVNVSISTDNSRLISTNFKAEIYPNPTSGKVWIQMNKPVDKLHMQVYSVDGKLISSSVKFNTTTVVDEDFSSYMEGLYFIRLTDNKNVIVKRLMIKK